LIRGNLWAVVAAVGLAVVGGCGAEPPAIERKIVAHSLIGCRLTGGEELVITALGDFGGSPVARADANGTDEVALPGTFLGAELLVPPSAWSGIGYADPPKDLNVTLWPSDDGCDISEKTVPAGKGGLAMTALGGGSGVLVAGPNQPEPVAGYALAIDLMTGRASEIGLPQRKTFASATEFGDGALVAGGFLDPGHDPIGQPIDKATVFSGGQFENATIELEDARARHGAVTLSNGETLLVGGTRDGAGVLATMVAVSPVTRNTRVFGLGTLRFARKDPVVIRLANGQILVGGGTDASDQPVRALEWFGPDGGDCTAPGCPEPSSTLPARRDMAFVALPAGGALAAGGFDAATAAREVWWITPEGTAQPLDPLAPEDRSSGRLRLVAASDGAPWAWTGSKWLRFDPWQARFVPPPVAPRDGPADDAPAPVSVDPGLFVWVPPAEVMNGQSALRGFRHGVRGRLARDAAPLLLADASHVAPDRPPRPGLVAFDTTDGLHLAKRVTETAPRAVVTDTLYADFDLSADCPSGTLPEIEIGASVVGAGSCTWPGAGTGSSLTLHRRGTSIEVVVGGTSKSCPGPEGRVAVALRAPAFGEATVKKLVIARQ
jgi:hypothetical protein